jgi:Big-like domain-containing protein
MHSERQSLTTVVVCAVAAFAVAGCGDGGSSRSASAQPVTLTGMEVSPSGAPVLAVPMGDLQFTAVGAYSDGSTAEITASVIWASSNPSVATISGSALATLSAEGATDISATDPETGVSAKVAVSVLPSPLVSLDVSPIDPTILIGSSLQLTAWGTLADETSVDCTSSVTWTSAAETVATVSPTGLAAGVALGVSPIEAKDPITAIGASTNVSVTDVLGLSYVALSRGSVVGGGSVQITGVVVLTSYTPLDTEVTLWSTDETAVTVPASVVVPAGSDRVSFSVTTMPVTQKARVFVWASDGTIEKRASLNVRKQR